MEIDEVYQHRWDKGRMNKSKWLICPKCEGEGTICSLSHDNGITSSEWDEMTDGGRDYEFLEAYGDGVYDKQCPFCKGSGKISDEQLNDWKAECEQDDEQEMWKHIMAQQEGY